MSENHNDDKTQSYTPLTKDTMVGHYRIVEKIGAGGMGEVYLAEDTNLKRKVALKFLPQHLCQDEGCRKRFKREAQAAAKLNHPNIVTIHDVSEHQGRPFFAMEYVEGHSLKEHIQQGDIIHERIIIGVIQICDGLQTAHSAGIIHRDIKPSNIILDVNRRPRILDFGLAAVSGTAQLTKTGSTMGTVGYMSPEQISGREVDHRSDLFSIGVVLYELFSGRLPFGGDTEAATHQAILHNTAEPLARYKSAISDDLQRIVSKLLEKDPGLRYQSAAGLISDLKKLTQSRSDINTASRAVGTDVRPSIAVLPFENLSADPDQEYFCDGMAEEIINALTHVDGLHVVARTSCFAFKGKHEDIREIGRKLNVDHVLEGSVRKAGNRIRITGQLIKISDGYHLWSEKYDRDMEDVFAIQDEISLAIVNKLKGKLLEEEETVLVKRYTDDLEAYNLYLRGNHFSQMWTIEGFEKAIECFEQTLQIDPNYALAYTGIAEVYYFQSFFGSLPPKEAIPKVKTYLKKALNIDEQLAEAHAILGRISFSYDWNWIVAKQEFKRALECNPNSPLIHFHYSHFLSITGQHEEAIIEIKRSRELDPLSININANVGELLYLAGQFNEAIEDLQKTITIDQNWFYSHVLLGLSYLGKSMIKESIVELEKAVEISGGNLLAVLLLGIDYHISCKKPQAEKLFNSLKERAKHEYVPATFFFMIHKISGDMDQALEWLERACEDRDIYLPYYLINPDDNYHIPYDQRSTELLRRVGLLG